MSCVLAARFLLESINFTKWHIHMCSDSWLCAYWICHQLFVHEFSLVPFLLDDVAKQEGKNFPSVVYKYWGVNQTLRKLYFWYLDVRWDCPSITLYLVVRASSRWGRWGDRLEKGHRSFNGERMYDNYFRLPFYFNHYQDQVGRVHLLISYCSQYKKTYLHIPLPSSATKMCKPMKTGPSVNLGSPW